MKFIPYFLLRSLLILPVIVFCLWPNTRSTAHTVLLSKTMLESCDLDVDGTQLVDETKALVADLLHVSVSAVSASYCCQMTDGRFKYSASSGAQSGYVYWTIEHGQIVEDDIEGF